MTVAAPWTPHLRHGEAREQALKVRPVDELVEAAAHLRLGGAGRPDQQDVLTGHGGKQQQPDLQRGTKR